MYTSENKGFASKLALALVTSQVGAKTIHNSCLVLSNQTAGLETGTFMTNEDQLTSSAVTDEMRLHSITTCSDSTDSVTGLQFFLASNPYEDGVSDLYEMQAIGQMTGECETLKLPDGLDRIKASLSPEESDLSIKYKVFSEVLSKVYGDIDKEDFVQWDFTEEKPLVGLYGRQSEAGIDQLGFITLNIECQLAHEEVIVTPEEPVDLEEVVEVDDQS